MANANGFQDQVKNAQQKEEKMNARRVLCAVCVLVVGLLLVLERPALAGSFSVEYWLGERPVYGPGGGPVAPKVRVPSYQAHDSRVPDFLRGRGGSYNAAPKLAPLYGYPPGSKVAPKVPVPQYKSNNAGPPWGR